LKKKKIARKGPSTSKLSKVLIGSLVLNPALYLFPFENAFVQAVSAASVKAPFISKALPDFHTGVGNPLTLDLNTYFGGISSYSASVSNPVGFGATINGNSLTFTNDRTGTTTVSVTGTAASGGTVTDTFDVSVVPDSLDKDSNGLIDISEIAAYVSSRPITKAIMNETLNFITPQKMTTPNTAPKSIDTTVTTYKDSPITISPNDLFTDEDSLTIDTFSLSSAGYVSANVVNNQLIVNGLQHGSLSLDLSVHDSRGGKASNRYDLIVGNRAPIFQGNNITVTQNTYSSQIDLNTVFTDPDGDTLQFGTVNVTQAGTYIQVEKTNNLLKIYGAAVGTSTVTTTANDSYGGTTTGSFNVTVSNATYGNHAPTVVTQIANQSKYKGEALSFTPGSYFTDVDGDPLNFTATSSMPNVATAALISGSLTVTPKVVGTTVITFTATDTSGAAVSQSFELTVTNRAPVATAIPAQTTRPGNLHSLSFTAASYFTDPDGDVLTYSAATSTPSVATVSLINGQLYVIPVAIGTTQVTLTAADSYGGTSNLSFDVVVAPNSAPQYVSGLDDMLIASSGTTTINLAGTFADADAADTLIYSCSVASSGSLVTAGISGNLLTILAGTGHGSATVTITATDNDGASEYRLFDVKVNQAPTLIGSAYPGFNYSNSTLSNFNVASRFSDPDNDTLTYTASIVGNTSVPLTVASLSSGNLNERTIIGLPKGTHTVTLTAKDSYGGSVSDTLSFIVTNSAPVATNVGTLQLFKDVTRQIPLAEIFEDADGDTLTWTITYVTGDVSLTSSTSDSLDVTGTKAGSGAITVSVTDGDGGTVVEAIQFYVSDYSA
jgi:hypothetical protein